MSILRFTAGPSRLERLLAAAGESLVKEAGEPTPAYNLSGQLYLSPSGYVLLAVPNALVRGVFAAMHEPGAELPPGHDGGPFNAHITVFRPDELELIGGADRVTERGKQFLYTIGRLMSVEPDGWPGVSRAFYLGVHSPELQALRRSYGLSSLPDGGRRAFHVTVAVTRRGVLGRSASAKGQASAAGAPA
jgi:hypothetical protein